MKMTLKPQDVLVSLKVASLPANVTYAALAGSLGMSASETHAAVRRAQQCRLLTRDSHPGPVWRNLHDLLVCALPLVLPLELGPPASGMPTSYAAAPIADQILMEDQGMPPVWPSPHGTVRGISIMPLYHSAPYAATVDPCLYEWLAITDALRSREPRVHELARNQVEHRIRAASIR